MSRTTPHAQKIRVAPLGVASFMDGIRAILLQT